MYEKEYYVSGGTMSKDFYIDNMKHRIDNKKVRTDIYNTIDSQDFIEYRLISLRSAESYIANYLWFLHIESDTEYYYPILTLNVNTSSYFSLAMCYLSSNEETDEDEELSDEIYRENNKTLPQIIEDFELEKKYNKKTIENIKNYITGNF